MATSTRAIRPRPRRSDRLEPRARRRQALDRSTTSAARSMSASVVVRPRESRSEPRASSAGMPRAVSTCDGSSEPVVHAEPTDAAMSWRSSAVTRSAPSTPSTTTESRPGAARSGGRSAGHRAPAGPPRPAGREARPGEGRRRLLGDRELGATESPTAPATFRPGPPIALLRAAGAARGCGVPGARLARPCPSGPRNQQAGEQTNAPSAARSSEARPAWTASRCRSTARGRRTRWRSPRPARPYPPRCWPA